jgi:putative ABC transport system permease protein
MLRNYFKVAIRYLAKYKGYTFINIAGLSVGIASCILIMFFVKSEWSFDRFHTKSPRIYRAWLQEHYQGEYFRNTSTPIPLGPVLQAGLPEAEKVCRYSEVQPAIKRNSVVFNDVVGIVDSNFFSVFDFKLIEGDVNNPFPTPNSIVMTKKAAEKYFGSVSPVGKSLEMKLGEDNMLFNVTAIVEAAPLESSIQYEMLIPFSNAPHVWGERVRTAGWSNVSVETYVLLRENSSVPAVNAKISSIMDPLVKENYKPGEYLVRLQPIHDIHFNSTLPEDMAKPSDPKYSYILASIGILILLIACINFVTLSLGRSTTRALEVGIRKVLGAERQQLIRQFWGEALLLTVVSLVLGILMALALQKPFSELANRQLPFSFDAFTILFCILIAGVIALFAGIYPAIVLSGFKPIQVLKGRLRTGNSLGLFRRGLIVGQFVASIVMIIGTFVVSEQLNYLHTKNLGYNKEHIVIVPTNKGRKEGMQLAQLFQHSIQKNPEVVGSTAALYSMAELGWMQFGYTDDKKVFRWFLYNTIDADFVNTMGLEIVRGRTFSKDIPADSNYILVNEALVKEYGWKDPIGQHLPGKYDERVLGVIKDFHIESLHSPIRPAVLALKGDSIRRHSSDVSFTVPPQPRVSVRFRGGNLEEHVASLRTAWKSVAGDQDFEYKFLDDELNAAYRQEERLSQIVRYASVLSIFIACMGLFGLATLVVARRTKEIGIRKVLGAEVGSIVMMMSKEFVILVVIASIISFPFAWWGLQKWLQDFAYRISIPWIAFVASALLALIIALVTVSTQSIRAALTNPVKSLRTE